MPHEIILAIKNKTCKNGRERLVVFINRRQVLVAVAANNIIIALKA